MKYHNISWKYISTNFSIIFPDNVSRPNATVKAVTEVPLMDVAEMMF